MSSCSLASPPSPLSEHHLSLSQPINPFSLSNSTSSHGAPNPPVTLSLFIKRNGTSPSISSFNKFLFSLLNSNDPSSVEFFVSSISRFNLSPNSQTFFLIIRFFCRNNKLDEAKQLLKTMVASGTIPTITAFAILINEYCKRGRIKHAIDVFNILKRSVGGGGEVDAALETMHEMIEYGHWPKMSTYNTVIWGLCNKGRIDVALTVLGLMIRNNTSPNESSYISLISGLNREGRTLDAGRLYGIALKQGMVGHRVRVQESVRSYEIH